MTLRNKLLMGFSGLLVLILLIAYSSWKTMENLNQRSQNAASLQNAAQNMFSGQVNQLRYLLYDNKSFIEPTKKDLAEAREFLEEIKAKTEIEKVREVAATLSDKLTVFEEVFTELTAVNTSMAQMRSQINAYGADVEQRLLDLQKICKDAFLADTTNMVAFEVFSESSLMLFQFGKVRGNMQRFIREPRQDLRLEARATLNDMQQILTKCGQILRTEKGKAANKAAEEAYKTYRTGMVAYADAAEKRTAVQARSASVFNDLLENANNASALVFSIAKEEKDSATNLLFMITLAAMLLGGGVAFFLSRNVIKQLGKDPGELSNIARRVVDGDYNVDDGGKKMGVYGSIVEMVNALKTHIDNAQRESENAKEQSRKAQEAMAQAEAASKEARTKTEAMLVAADKLEQVGGVVSSASTQLSAQIEQSDRGAAESAQRLSEAATAMNEMNATVQEVAKNAGSASSASAETKQKAEAGAQVVEKTVRNMEEVHQVSLELREDMAQLNEHAQNITRIMGVISDIADQTNLLALNAAIEAARAGDAGRGFAVVADEVRKLAEKTMASTTDVGNAIKAIQESTAKSMTGVDNAVERIGEATELASQSGAALQEIVDIVEVTADQVNAIATASEEQSAASEEINQSIVQVNDMSRQTAEAMAEAAKAVSDLAAQAQGLTDLIQELKAA